MQFLLYGLPASAVVVRSPQGPIPQSVYKNAQKCEARYSIDYLFNITYTRYIMHCIQSQFYFVRTQNPDSVVAVFSEKVREPLDNDHGM